jgi:hypothetical protein
LPQVGLTVPKRWKDVCDGDRSQVTDQPALGVGDDETLLRSLPADRRKPRIGEAGRRIVRLQLEPCDGQQSVDVGGVGLCSRTAQAGKRQSKGGCPGLHRNAWAGRTILRPLEGPRNSKVRSIPPPKPCQWVAQGTRPGAATLLGNPLGRRRTTMVFAETAKPSSAPAPWMARRLRRPHRARSLAPEVRIRGLAAVIDPILGVNLNERQG